MLDTVSDSDLVTSFKNGNQGSFEEITNRYAAKVYNMAKRLVRSQEDAEEVLQDVFVTLYAKILPSRFNRIQKNISFNSIC